MFQYIEPAKFVGDFQGMLKDYSADDVFRALETCLAQNKGRIVDIWQALNSQRAAREQAARENPDGYESMVKNAASPRSPVVRECLAALREFREGQITGAELQKRAIETAEKYRLPRPT
jgi:hypothetical protein